MILSKYKKISISANFLDTGRKGFEPLMAVPKTAVLPLH